MLCFAPCYSREYDDSWSRMSRLALVCFAVFVVAPCPPCVDMAVSCDISLERSAITEQAPILKVVLDCRQNCTPHRQWVDSILHLRSTSPELSSDNRMPMLSGANSVTFPGDHSSSLSKMSVRPEPVLFRWQENEPGGRNVGDGRGYIYP